MFKIVRGNSYYCHVIRGQFDQMSDMMKTGSSRSFEGNWRSYRGHLNISNVFASLQATWWPKFHKVVASHSKDTGHLNISNVFCISASYLGPNFIKLWHRTPKIQGHICPIGLSAWVCVSQNRMVYTYHLENDGSEWVCAGLESTKWAFQSNSSPSKRFTLTVVGCNVVVVFRNTISLGTGCL